MSSSKDIKLKTFVLLFLLMLFSTTGNVILDLGMKQIGSLDISSGTLIWQALRLIFHSATIWIGIAGMLLFMVSEMLVLSWADYSFVMPFIAVSYALVPLYGFVFLGEHVPAMRWLGITCVVLGVVLVSRTPPRTTSPDIDAPLTTELP